MSKDRYPAEFYFPDLKDLVDQLDSDITFTLEHLNTATVGDEHHYWARTLVHIVFSGIEGALYALKRTAIHSAETTQVKFTPKELAQLREWASSIKNGKEEIEVVQVGFEDNFKLAFRKFSKATKSLYTLDCSGSDWQRFRTAIEIRHRITHPKRVSDLLLEPPEVQTVLEAYRWYVDNFNKCVQAAVRASGRV